MTNRNTITALTSNSKEMRKASEAKMQAQAEYRHAKMERYNIKREFIGEAFDDFFQEISEKSYLRQNYIDGSYSSEFTRNVERVTISEKHRMAQHAFVEAQRNLAKTFIEEVERDPNNAREIFRDYGNLKNMARLARDV